MKMNSKESLPVPGSLLKLALIACAIALVPVCQAQTDLVQAEDYISPIKLEIPASAPLNRIGINYLMGFNMSVNFSHLGGLQLSDPGPPSGSTVNRTYDNGYNYVDISGNSGNLTWYWGYQSPQSAQGGNLVLQSDSTPPTAASGRYQDRPQSGIELTYSRELTRGKHLRFGVETAFGYNAISISDDQTLSYYAYRTSDSYALNGVILPAAPYSGTFAGPGPLIPSSLTSADRSITVLPDAATISGQRKVDASVFLLRLGPYLEVPLSRKFSMTLSGGLSLAVADTVFSFSESVSISDPSYGIAVASSKPSSASGSAIDLLVGGYGGASLAYALSDRVSLRAGAIFQGTGRAVDNQGGKQATLNLNQSVIVSIGASYAF